MLDAFLFWFLTVVIFLSTGILLFSANPIYSVLALVMVMVGVAAIFVTLSAYFLAGVQLIVYAGAVMVLFVMVMMLFDTKSEINPFVRGGLNKWSRGLLSLGLLALLVTGISVGAFSEHLLEVQNELSTDSGASMTALAKLLFNRYILVFELLGFLLLVVAVGAVALARSKGGTHAK
jgi:NADH-quinone oxidoreductase subunit J